MANPNLVRKPALDAKSLGEMSQADILLLSRYAKNYLINGNFDFWQRGGSITTPGSAIYTADRWYVTFGTGTHVVTRSSDVPASSTSRYSLQLAGGAAIANPRIVQRVESVFARGIAGKTVTIKGKYKVTDSTGFAINLAVDIPTLADNYTGIISVINQNIATTPVVNAWTEFSVSFVLPSSAINGVSVTLLRATTAATATTTLFNEMMLVEGETTTVLPYIYAGQTVIGELQLCQRYYEKSYALDTAPGTPGLANGPELHMYTGGGTSCGAIPFKVIKRSSPSVNLYRPSTGTIGQIEDFGEAALAISSIFSSTYGIGYINVAPATINTGFQLMFTADAEL